MATYTSSQVTNRKVRELVTGLQMVTGGPLGSGGTTISVSDVFEMVPVPHGAIIQSVEIWGNAPGIQLYVKVGDGGDDDRYGSVTISGTAGFTRLTAVTGQNYKYSLSADSETRYDTIDLTVNTASSVTVTCSITLRVVYMMAPE